MEEIANRLNRYFQKDIQNSAHPSDFEVAEGVAVLILQLPYIDGEQVRPLSYPFVIDVQKGEVYLYHRRKGGFEKLGDLSALHSYLNLRVDKILSKLNKFHTEIAQMEDHLYEGKTPADFSNRWLKLKKYLSLIERLMTHALLAFERFIRYFKIDDLGFKDLEEHLSRAVSFAKSGNQKLDYLYEFFRVKQDEKMNRVMFFLTIISGIFLPLSLVTGFFGMNTGGLPLVHDPYGTIKAVVIALLLEVPFIGWLYLALRREKR